MQINPHIILEVQYCVRIGYTELYFNDLWAGSYGNSVRNCNAVVIPVDPLTALSLELITPNDLRQLLNTHFPGKENLVELLAGVAPA